MNFRARVHSIASRSSAFLNALVARMILVARAAKKSMRIGLNDCTSLGCFGEARTRAEAQKKKKPNTAMVSR
jgi:hypothetical protein